MQNARYSDLTSRTALPSTLGAQKAQSLSPPSGARIGNASTRSQCRTIRSYPVALSPAHACAILVAVKGTSAMLRYGQPYIRYIYPSGL